MEEESFLFDENKSSKNLNSSSKLKQDSLENLDESQVEFKVFICTQNLPESQANPLDLYEQMLDYVESLTASYIWNNEKFYINKPVKATSDQQIDYTCFGCVDFGDNLEDEWFIVYLLFKLTEKFNIIAKVNDFDGEFLLIHSANYLPAWASSAADNCMNNRVFIYQGALHLIPPATNPSQITYLPAYGSIQDSLHGAKVVFDFAAITRAPQSIQDCLQKQLSKFEPSVIGKNLFHRATCLIPAKLAWLLKSNPGLISSAINRFCEKDPKDLKLCSTLRTFTPVDLVNYRVQFTKNLYGKLKYSEYKPEKRHNWPSLANNQTEKLDLVLTTLNRERSLLGFKLTCAFEIIAKQILSDQVQDKSFENYVRKLKNLGYFKDYLENSKKYNELMQKAKEGFKQESSQENSNFDKYSNLIDSFYLDKIINEDYVVKIKEEISNIQEKEVDDSDDWLCVEAPQLDDYLEMYSRGDVGSTYDFRIISNAFKNFMQKPSKNKKEDLLQGVDFKLIDKSNEEKLIDFNVDSIEQNLKDILSLKNDKLNHNLENEQNNEEEDDDDDESDSFYEIDDDLLENEENLESYMSAMDNELKGEGNLSRLDNNKEKADDLDIDLNLVTNALESYSSQLGFTGPVSNILKSLGL